MKYENLQLKKLVNYFKDNDGMDHKCKYHQETYLEHCMLVLSAAMFYDETETGYRNFNGRNLSRVTEEFVYAAALHDIAKPRCAGKNKLGEACFYGHEKVTREEMVEFLDPKYEHFELVIDVIQCHMIPFQLEQGSNKAKEKLDIMIAKHGQVFEDLLFSLNDLDKLSAISTDIASEYPDIMDTAVAMHALADELLASDEYN